MTITTLEKTKNVLQINGTNKDLVIIELIPMVEDWIKGYCNDDFTETPPGYELIAIKIIEFNLNQKAGFASEGLSRHSVSFATDYPTSITKGLRRKMRW
jgi:hypothetical protein